MTSNDVGTKTDAALKAEPVDMKLEVVVFALAWLEKEFAQGISCCCGSRSTQCGIRSAPSPASARCSPG